MLGIAVNFGVDVLDRSDLLVARLRRLKVSSNDDSVE